MVYALRNNSSLAREVLENIGAAGQKTRKYYQRRLPEDPSKDYYFIHRLTGKTEPLLVEYGFIDNRNDLNKLQNNLLDYGEGVVKAVTEYLGYNYVAPNESTVGNKTYTVKKGDTLYSIAKRVGVDVNELIKFNNLTSNTLSIGQVLNIPGDKDENMNMEYLTYVVKPGDSLYAIANKYGVKVDDIINFNNLSSTLLSVGQNLLIPGVSSGDMINNEGQYYKVQAGDNLYNIARKFNVSVNDIMLANSLNSTLLVIGQELYIPTGSVIENPSSPLKYTVVKGDTLYSIANKFNTSVNKLKELNNLGSNVLSVGQILTIPE